MSYYVYVLQNQENNKIYVGQTANLEERLKRHNGLLKSKAKSFTNKNRGIWEIVYKEMLATRKDAMAREKQLKSSRGRAFIKSIIQPPIA